MFSSSARTSSILQVTMPTSVSPMWPSSLRTSFHLRVSIPAQFLTYVQLLSQDPSVLSVLVSLPSFQLTVLHSTSTFLHLSTAAHFLTYGLSSLPHPLPSKENLSLVSDWLPSFSVRNYSPVECSSSMWFLTYCLLLTQEFLSLHVRISSQIWTLHSSSLRALHPILVSITA